MKNHKCPPFIIEVYYNKKIVDSFYASHKEKAICHLASLKRFLPYHIVKYRRVKSSEKYNINIPTI